MAQSKTMADSVIDLKVEDNARKLSRTSMVSIAEAVIEGTRSRRSSGDHYIGTDGITGLKDENSRMGSMDNVADSSKQEAKVESSSRLFTGVLKTFEEIRKDAELTPYKEAFELLDIDGNGEITTEDLSEFLTNMNEEVPESEIQEMIKLVDVDENGSINFSEFHRLMKDDEEGQDSEQDMIDAFQVFDHEHNGFVSVGDLKRIMLDLGDPITEEELADLITEIDLDHDGLINYNEFINVMNT